MPERACFCVFVQKSQTLLFAPRTRTQIAESRQQQKQKQKQQQGRAKTETRMFLVDAEAHWLLCMTEHQGTSQPREKKAFQD